MVTRARTSANARAAHLVADAQLLRNVARAIRERQELATLTGDVLAALGAVTPDDASKAARYWEQANAQHASRLLLRAGEYNDDAT